MNRLFVLLSMFGLAFVSICAGCTHQPTAKSVNYDETEVTQLREQIEQMDWE